MFRENFGENECVVAYAQYEKLSNGARRKKSFEFKYHESFFPESSSETFSPELFHFPPIKSICDCIHLVIL